MSASALTLEPRVSRLEHDSFQILSLLLETRHDMADGFERLEIKMDQGFAAASARADATEASIDRGFAKTSSCANALETKIDRGFTEASARADQAEAMTDHGLA